MSKYQNAPELKELALGQVSQYPERYDASQLQAVPRSLNRDDIQIQSSSLPFHGDDDWTGYEVSWLNAKGKPCVAIGLFRVPCASANLIESKSFKLYLNSYNQTRFAALAEVEAQMRADLSHCAGLPVQVILLTPDTFQQLPLVTLEGTSLDELDIEVESFAFNPGYLANATGEEWIQETVVSHLLKSNCLITGQPDWGSVQVRYEGKAINHECLLRYLLSFRQHNEFHEQCVERIFTDILRFCQPEKLTVQARYTRRGGLDINPFRSNFEQSPSHFRMARQ